MPLPVSRGLTVLRATYGAGQTQRDVKDIVKSKIQNGRLDFRAHSGALGGDPVFGQVKTFYIKYIAGGESQKEAFERESACLYHRQSFHHAPHQMKYWEIIADRLSQAGWSLGCVSGVDSVG